MRWGKSKYGNRKVKYKGEWFDSQHELDRYLELLLLERAGEIRSLRRQVKYPLIPAQREPDTIGPRGGVHKGALIEQECYYKADFVYVQNGREIVEDAKGYRTDDYVIKRKLMLWVHGIRIHEV